MRNLTETEVNDFISGEPFAKAQHGLARALLMPYTHVLMPDSITVGISVPHTYDPHLYICSISLVFVKMKKPCWDPVSLVLSTPES